MDRRQVERIAEIVSVNAMPDERESLLGALTTSVEAAKAAEVLYDALFGMDQFGRSTDLNKSTWTKALGVVLRTCILPNAFHLRVGEQPYGCAIVE